MPRTWTIETVGAYYAVMPVIPLWVVLVSVVLVAAVTGAIIWLVGALLASHRPRRYWSIASITTGGLLVLFAATGFWVHLSSIRPGDSMMESIVDQAWPHLAPASVTGEVVRTGTGQTCELVTWSERNERFLMVTCDGSPVSRLG